MASFFSGFSSAVGKKLLLFGLRHIDVLDKDPAEFVSVDVGKQTTLEVTDVGLHVKVGSRFRFASGDVLTSYCVETCSALAHPASARDPTDHRPRIRIPHNLRVSVRRAAHHNRD